MEVKGAQVNELPGGKELTMNHGYDEFRLSTGIENDKYRW